MQCYSKKKETVREGANIGALRPGTALMTALMIKAPHRIASPSQRGRHRARGSEKTGEAVTKDGNRSTGFRRKSIPVNNKSPTNRGASAWRSRAPIHRPHPSPHLGAHPAQKAQACARGERITRARSARDRLCEHVGPMRERDES